MRIHLTLTSILLSTLSLNAEQQSNSSTGTQTTQDLCKACFPWSKHIPTAIREQYIEPDALLDEPSSDWREKLQDIVAPIIKDCTNAEEAAKRIATQIKSITGVEYSRERIRPNMSPIEMLESKKGSCTGLSILYAAALRSVDIPSRIVGVNTWNHVPGNHTWTEVWLNGQWRMLELGENQFNTAWVMEAVGMLDPKQPAQRILAITGKRRSTNSSVPHFRLPWNRKNTTIEAQDVSKHYQQLAQDWYKKQGLSDQTQRLLVSVYPPLVQASVLKLVNKDGTVIDSGNLPKANEDMRKMLALNLPRDTKQEYYLVFANGRRIKVQPTTAPSQVLRLEREKYNNS